MAKATRRTTVVNNEVERLRALLTQARADRDTAADEFRVHLNAGKTESDKLKVENLTLRQQADTNTARMNELRRHVTLVEHQLSIVRQTVAVVYGIPGVSIAAQGGSNGPVPMMERPR